MDIAELLDGLESGEIDADEIGWQILDPEGNVVSSGPVTFAQMTSELQEQFGIAEGV